MSSVDNVHAFEMFIISVENYLFAKFTSCQSKLTWLQKQITLLVEIRDAISPQLEIATKYIGNIFVTILTKVVGKAIGLVGKGILQGLGRSKSI